MVQESSLQRNSQMWWAVLLLGMCPGEQKTCSNKNHNSSTHNSQKVQTARCVASDEWWTRWGPSTRRCVLGHEHWHLLGGTRTLQTRWPEEAPLWIHWKPLSVHFKMATFMVVNYVSVVILKYPLKAMVAQKKESLIMQRSAASWAGCSLITGKCLGLDRLGVHSEDSGNWSEGCWTGEWTYLTNELL